MNARFVIKIVWRWGLFLLGMLVWLAVVVGSVIGLNHAAGLWDALPSSHAFIYDIVMFLAMVPLIAGLLGWISRFYDEEESIQKTIKSSLTFGFIGTAMVGMLVGSGFGFVMGIVMAVIGLILTLPLGCLLGGLFFLPIGFITGPLAVVVTAAIEIAVTPLRPRFWRKAWPWLMARN